MKSKLLIATLGISAVAFMSGCHKKVASAAPPPPPPPAAREAPAPPPPPAPRAAAPAARPAPPAESPTEAIKTSKQLADYLNKLLDAYFDYDKAELRADAQSALNTNSSELRALLQEFPNTKF